MYADYEDGADTHCVHCGAPVWFDVGFSSEICKSCGKNYNYTDEDIQRRKEEDARIAARLEEKEEFTGRVIDLLYSFHQKAKTAEEKKLLLYAMHEVDMFHPIVVGLEG